MTYQKANITDVDSKVPEGTGGMWFLKDALDSSKIGFTILELNPNETSNEHDHDEQEEIYYVESGSVDVTVNGDTVTLNEGEVIRIDPEDTRQIQNRNEPSRLILVGAPL